MYSQPRSPNIFDAVHLSAVKPSSPLAQEVANNTTYFNKRLESITQFLDFLDYNPDNHTELTELELRWERNFFKSELKASLFLNHSLITLYCQINYELEQLKADFQNRTEKKKVYKEIENKLEWHIQSPENYQDNSNSVTAIKKRTAKEAFEAERKILQAKHQKQCDDLKKIIEHKDEILRKSYEENEYIRSELLEISEKNYALLNDNREIEENKRRLEEENKELRMKLEQRENKSNSQMNLNQINCSPIKNDSFRVEEGEISFNHEFLNENLENRLLRKKIEEIQLQLAELKTLNSRLINGNSLENDQQHMEVMQESCRLFFVELQKQYHDVKTKLHDCIIQINKHKKTIREIEEANIKNTMRQAFQREIELSQRQNSKDFCSNCLVLSKDYEALKEEKQKVQAKYQALRQKFDKTLTLELAQRQQWDTFLKDLKASPTE